MKQGDCDPFLRAKRRLQHITALDSPAGSTCRFQAFSNHGQEMLTLKIPRYYRSTDHGDGQPRVRMLSAMLL
jgi:hypothetical protein